MIALTCSFSVMELLVAVKGDVTQLRAHATAEPRQRQGHGQGQGFTMVAPLLVKLSTLHHRLLQLAGTMESKAMGSRDSLARRRNMASPSGLQPHLSGEFCCWGLLLLLLFLFLLLLLLLFLLLLLLCRRLYWLLTTMLHHALKFLLHDWSYTNVWYLM